MPFEEDVVVSQLRNCRFHFWQPAINEHEAGWIKELSSQGYEVHVYAGKAVAEARQKLGLGAVDYGLARISHPSAAELPSLLSDCASESDIHFFTGIKEFPLNRRAYGYLKNSSARIFYISESKDWRGIKGAARYVRDRILDFHKPRRISAVLAMGALGANWFRRLGYLGRNVFEFGYCTTGVPINLNVGQSSQDNTAKLSIAFCGQLIRRKRVDLLLDACQVLKSAGCSFSLDIIGFGPEEESLREQVKRLQLSEDVRFTGPLKNADLRNRLTQIDLVVLPSDWDGWGAIVNEALLAGCRVGATDRCGASVLLKDPLLGFLFSHGSQAELSDALLQEHKKLPQARQALSRRLQKTDRVIGAKAVAEYLLRIVMFSLEKKKEKPGEPWKAHSQTMSLAVIYHYFPHYRAGIIEGLSEAFPNTTFYGDPRADYAGIAPYRFSEGTRFVKAPFLEFKGLYWQSRILQAAAFGAHEVYIFLANPRFITTWLAALICLVRKRRVLFWGHGYLHSPRNSFVSLYKRAFMGLCHQFLAYGEMARTYWLKEGLAPEKFVAFFNSLKKNDALQVGRIPADIWKNKAASFRILFISRLIPLAHYELAIEAVAEIARFHGIRIPIVVIGDGESRSSMTGLAKELSVEIEFLGALYDDERIAEVMNSVSIVVSPGKVGLTALHAMAHGVPVVSHSDMESQMPEVEAIEPGVTGELFEKGNVGSLAAAILKLYERRTDLAAIADQCEKMVNDKWSVANQIKIMRGIL